MKHLVFCLSAGRTGTARLANLLSHCPDTTAQHESDPNFLDIARPSRNDRRKGIDWWLHDKLPAIMNQPGTHYVETSHLFGKGPELALLDVLRDKEYSSIYPEVTFDLMFLSRPHREIALSYWRRNTIPGRTAGGNLYLLHPAAAIYFPVPQYKTLNNYQLCYWYALEMEARVLATVRAFEDAGLLERKIQTLTPTSRGFNSGTLVSYCDWYGIPRPVYEKLDDFAETVNATAPHLMNTYPPRDLEESENQLKDILAQNKHVASAIVLDDDAPIGVYTGEDASQTSVNYVILTTPRIAQFARKVLALSADMKHDASLTFSWDNPTSSNRNRIVKNFLDDERHPEWLCMMDEDTTPLGNFASVIDFANLDVDVIIFPTPIWQPAISPTEPLLWNIQMGDDHVFTIPLNMPDPTKGDFVEIKRGGSGALFIRRSVLEHPEMRAPFSDEFDEDGCKINGHDLAFCDRAKALGFVIVASLRYPCSHIKDVDLAHFASVMTHLQKQLHAAGEIIKQSNETIRRLHEERDEPTTDGDA